MNKWKKSIKKNVFAAAGTGTGLRAGEGAEKGAGARAGAGFDLMKYQII